MVLIIDNYDSFTYNIYQQVGGLGYDVKVVTHDNITLDDIRTLRPSHIIISAGPKRPEDSGISMKVISTFYKTIPILGICLGHQCIAQVFGSKIIEASEIIHGKAVPIEHNGGLFEGLSKTLYVARYNSLCVDVLPDNFILTAWDSDHQIMAIQHEDYPLFGVQFHPESFLTDHGDVIMRRFLLCEK